MSERSLRLPKFSAAIVAVIILIGFEMWMRHAHPMANWPTPNLERSEPYKLLTQFDADMSEQKAQRNRSCQPGVLLLGSSLVIAPLLQEESYFLNRPYDEFRHTRMQFLEAGDIGRNEFFSSGSSVYRLAVPGGMASDACLILNHLLGNNVKPTAIIYGIAPRDFHSNLLGPYVRTDTFRTIATPADLPEVARLGACSVQEFIDATIGRFSTFWLCRSEVRKYVWLRMKKTIDRLSPVALFERYNPVTGTRIQKDGQFPEDAPGIPTVRPNVPLPHMCTKEVMDAYRRDYNPVDPKLIEVQFSFFNRLMEICNDQKIKLVVVNMPLSRTNRELMAAGFYDSYLKRVQDCCNHHNIQFCNLQTDRWDDDASYIDTVHITPASSKRLITELVNELDGGTKLSSKSNEGTSLLKEKIE